MAKSTVKVVAAVALIVLIAIAGTYFVTRSSVPTSTATATSVFTSVAPAPSNATIIVEQPAGPTTLDPASIFYAQDEEAGQQVYQGLVSYAPNSHNIVTLMASNYTITPDGLTYTFWLRQGITFSNGDPVNSYVLWYSNYRSAIMGQAGAYYLTVAINIGNITAAVVNSFNATNNVPSPTLLNIMNNPTNSITTIGPYEIQFHLYRPFSAFLAMLTQPQSSAVDPRIILQHGGVVANETNTWMVENALGTGPFMITQYLPNTVTVYERNPVYWGGANGIQPTPRINEVIVKVVPDALTRLEDVSAGAAQLAYVDFSLGSEISSTGGVYVPKLGPEIDYQALTFDVQKFPFNNPILRLAVAHALNITEALGFYQGFATSFVGPIPKGILGYNSTLQPYSYNITLTNQLLAEAGYPGGKGLPPLKMMYSTDRPPENLDATLFEASLSQVGIQVSLEGLTDPQAGTLLSSVSPTSAQYPDLSFENWFNPPDPWGYADWLVGPLCYGSCNSAYYNNTQVNNLMNQAAGTVNTTARGLIYEHLDSIVYNDVPYVWIGQFTNAIPQGIPVASIKLQGFTSNLQFYQSDFSTLYLVS